MPKLTDTVALEFVKLIHTGISAESAVIFLVPSIAASELDDDSKVAFAEKIVKQWHKSRLVFDALARFSGGAWQDLDPDRRLSITRDKAYAEMAYFIYSHDYAKLEGVDLKKYNDARVAIDERLKGSDNVDSPFEKALRAIAKRMDVTPQELMGRMPQVAKTTQ